MSVDMVIDCGSRVTIACVLTVAPIRDIEWDFDLPNRETILIHCEGAGKRAFGPVPLLRLCKAHIIPPPPSYIEHLFFALE